LGLYPPNRNLSSRLDKKATRGYPLDMTEEQIWQVVNYNDGLVQKATLDWCKKHRYMKQDWISVGYMGAYHAVETYRAGHGAGLSHWMWMLIHQQLNKAWRREEAQATHKISTVPNSNTRTYEQKSFLTDPRKGMTSQTNHGSNDSTEESYFDNQETSVLEEFGSTQEFEEDTAHDMDVERNWRLMSPYLLLLDEKDQYILREYYWEGRTFAAIGKDLGMSRSGANLRFQNAIKKIQKMLQKEMA
jgi:RNA polymerase sigma factor (sigma-70 family)